MTRAEHVARTVALFRAPLEDLVPSLKREPVDPHVDTLRRAVELAGPNAAPADVFAALQLALEVGP